MTPLEVRDGATYELRLSGYHSARVTLDGADKTLKLGKRAARATRAPETYDPFEK